MELPQFPREKGCQKCPLWESATNVCIPLTPLHTKGEASKALVIIGEKPSIEEDKHLRHHEGPVGQITKDVYLKYVTDRIPGNLHVYGTHAVRCKPPLGADVTETQAKKCKPYLVEELKALKGVYDEVIVLSCGGPATKQLTGESLGKGYRKQGHLIDVEGVEVRFFCTLNPGILLPGRDPSATTSIEDHLLYLIDYLIHGKIPMEVDLIPQRWEPLNYISRDVKNGLVSFDIETYGCLEEFPPHTVFHPKKSVEVQKVKREDLVVCAAATWDDGEGVRHSALWVLPRDLPQLRQFLYRVVKYGHFILGMNIPFDIMYLREYDEVLRETLSREMGCKLVDLAISNFLESDVRPERSLKTIAPLLRVVEYDDESSLGAGFQYSDRDDPELHLYNVLDTVATLECHKKLVTRAKQRRPDVEKFGRWQLLWYSDVLWTVIEMDETGVKFSREALEKVQDEATARMAKLWNYVWCRWGYPLCGPGSKAFPKMIVERGVEEAGLTGDRRVARTKKTKEISTERDNLHLLLGVLPVGSETRLQIELLEAFRKDHKMVTSYTYKLLNIPEKGLVGDMAYPTWFGVPSSEKDGAGQMGGTQQGRLTCQGPGLQTSPYLIRRCMVSRYVGGLLLGADYSQIELRVPALFSGDPRMVEEYLRGADRHEQTAILIFGEKARGDPKLRQIGKTLNFLMLFQGGAKKFQETVRKDHGLELPLYVCKNAISAFRERYPVMIEWQEGLIETAKTKGYLAVPLTGESRTFLGSRASVEETYIPKIVNFPVQTTAANIMKGAQRQISDALFGAGLLSRCQENVYDAVYIDVPPQEREGVLGILTEVLPCPTFYGELQSSIGRTLPLGYEVKDVVSGEVLLKVK